MDSSLAATRPTHPSVTRLRYTNGVFPINYSTSQKRFNLLLFLSQITSQCQSKKMPRRWRTRNHFGARSPRWHPWRWSHPLSRQESETNQIKNKNQEHTHTKKKNHPQNHHINPEKLQSNPIRDNREGGGALPTDLTAKQQQSLLLLGKWRLVELEEEASGREVLYRRRGRGGPWLRGKARSTVHRVTAGGARRR